MPFRVYMPFGFHSGAGAIGQGASVHPGRKRGGEDVHGRRPKRVQCGRSRHREGRDPGWRGVPHRRRVRRLHFLVHHRATGETAGDDGRGWDGVGSGRIGQGAGGRRPVRRDTAGLRVGRRRRLTRGILHFEQRGERRHRDVRWGVRQGRRWSASRGGPEAAGRATRAVPQRRPWRTRGGCLPWRVGLKLGTIWPNRLRPRRPLRRRQRH
mmetsp:Transcript_8158/g.26909  ORF Transcript_8158/g.26909 Transcript_8158/m.26909 type:complete len:210 (-) Transcript_8158:481-1110(-)